MYTTSDENGILNNYPQEPEMYYAEYPSPEQQQRYSLMGGLAFLFVGTLFLVALSIS